MPAKMTISAILSKEESRNAPFLVVCFLIRATLPSTMSQKPESKIRTPPITLAKLQGLQSILMKVPEEYAIPATIDTARPIPVQKLAERPVEAKLLPSFTNEGSSESRSLFSNNFSTGFLYYNLFTIKEKVSRAFLLPSRRCILFQGPCPGR